MKYYFKLPYWFKILTPIGNYNPDWAVVLERDKKVYFVAETKNTGGDIVDFNKLRPSELLKIKCGEAHFSEFKDVNYKDVKSVSHLID